MKVLYVIDSLSAGAGRVVYDLVKFGRWKSVVVSIYPNGELEEDFRKLGVKIINLNKRPGMGLGMMFKIAKICFKGRIDLVHTHNVDAYDYGVLGAVLASCRVIHTAHGKSVKRSKFKKFREKIFHKCLSIFLNDYITVSNDLGIYAYKNWSLIKPKTIYNGVDTSKYKPLKVSRKFLLKYDINANDKIVGIVAGLRPVKNHSMLIKAMRIVVDKVKNAKLVIVGDGPERSRLEKLVSELKMEKNVVFLGNRFDTVKLYNSFDVNVLCSFSECFSMTLLEAMACGVPCIATNVGGNPELVNNLVSLDYEELASRIISSFGSKVDGNLIEVEDMIEDYAKVYQ